MYERWPTGFGSSSSRPGSTMARRRRLSTYTNRTLRVFMHPRHQIEQASTTEGLPISPSMGPALQREGLNVPAAEAGVVGSRTVLLSLIAIAVAIVAACIAQI